MSWRTAQETRAQAVAEVDARYRAEIAASEAEWQAQIDAPKAAQKAATDAQARDEARVRRKEAEAGLAAYQREMSEKKAAESRALLKARFDYPLFFYDAEKVGITATGEADDNELYPNDRRPVGLEQTALERYREFLAHIGDPGFFV